MPEYQIEDSIANAGYELNEGNKFTLDNRDEVWTITSLEKSELTFKHPSGTTITIRQRNHPEGDLPFELQKPKGETIETLFSADFFNQTLAAAELYMMGYNDGKA